MLDKDDSSASLRSDAGTHHSGGSGADHDDIEFSHKRTTVHRKVESGAPAASKKRAACGPLSLLPEDTPGQFAYLSPAM